MFWELKILLLSVLLFSVACQFGQEGNTNQALEQDIIEGELCFKLISFGSMYGASDSDIQRFESAIDSLYRLKNPTENVQLLKDLFETLEQNALLYKPYFHIRTDSSYMATVYVNESEYEKIDQFDMQTLLKENCKIKLRLKGQTLKFGIMNCQSIISVEEVEGATFWKK